MKIAVRIVSALLLLVVGALTFAYFSPDYDLFFVRSQSMVPKINMGDVVVTASPGSMFVDGIRPGTVVTYRLGKTEVTHRVIAIENGATLITKGDNSEDPDPAPVNISQIVGVYLFKIPYVGYLTSFVRTKMGWWLCIILPAILLVVFIIKDIFREAFSQT